MSKNKVADVQRPIVQDCSGVRIEVEEVSRLVGLKLLKPEDSELHWRLFHRFDDVPELTPGARRALFYPSAGKDILLPLLVGLPYCTDFFFYERFAQLRCDVQGIVRAIGLKAQPASKNERSECYECIKDTVPRRIWIMRADNETFLEEDGTLAFYFHRGDSEGEGGSGQRWDSDLLPRLLQKGDPRIGLRVLTDGEPGGISEDVRSRLQQVSLPNSHRGRDYFYGLLPCR